MDEAFDRVRIRRDNSLRLAKLIAHGEVPCRGPFFFIDGGVYSHPEPLVAIERLGNAAPEGVTHAELFQTLSRSIPKIRRIRWAVGDRACLFRRGRVSACYPWDQFTIHVSSDIPTGAYDIILRDFGLSRLAQAVVIVTTDPVYNRSFQDLEDLAAIVAQTGIPIS